MIKKIVITIVMGVLASLVADTVMYPGFSLKYVGIDSKLLMWLVSTGLVILSLLNIRFFKSEWGEKLVKIFYVLMLIFVVSTGLKNVNYETFVLEKWHFYPSQLFFVGLYLGLLGIVAKGVNKSLIGPLLLCLVVGVYLLNRDFFLTMVKEDGLVESAQAAFYLISSLVFLIGAKGKKMNWLIGCLLLFVFFEEISWGQRLLGFKTPEFYISTNIQKETTIHNEKQIDPIIHFVYIAVGLLGLWGWRAKRVIAPSASLGFYFGIIAVYFFMHTWSHKYYDIASAVQTSVPRWQEVCELFLSIGFLLFSVESVKSSYGKNKKGR